MNVLPVCNFPTIYLYTHFTLSNWDYRSPDEGGIGGSETCHAELAWRFAQRGYKVVSYAPIPDDCPPLHKGVEWIHYSKADFNQDGVWIFSRCPKVLQWFTPSPNRRAWLICQDETYDIFEEDKIFYWDEAIREKIDIIVTLCEKQRQGMVFQHPDCKYKMLLGSNGIRVDVMREIEKENIQRNPHKLIYFSSPDRGLFPLLKIFKKAREYVPDLELVVAYGFNNIDIFTQNTGHEYLSKAKDMVLPLLDQPGVTWKGRLGQKELFREILSSGIWCYPTNFSETSCIACMEAQALGAIPIFSNIGALANNVHFGERITGNIHDNMILSHFTESLIKWATHPEIQDEIRERMMTIARSMFNWERIVDKYESWIMGLDTSKHDALPHGVFQLAYGREGKVVNIGCNIDSIGFRHLGAVNVDVVEEDPCTHTKNPIHVLADARDLSCFKNGEFDTAILGEILEHFATDEDAIKALKEAKRIVGEKGKVVITVPEDYRTFEEIQAKSPQISWDEKNILYAPNSLSYHHRPITKELLYEWLEKANLTPVVYRPMDYGFCLAHGVVAI